MKTKIKDKQKDFAAIRKRDGRLTPFDKSKINQAIFKALYATGSENVKLSEELAEKVTLKLKKELEDHIPQVEEIQDIVEQILIQEGYDSVAKAYILYRAKRNAIREGKSTLMDAVDEILKSFPERRKTAESPSGKMLKIASTASRNYYLSRLIPYQYSDAHRKALLHIHDLDFYSKTINNMELRLNKLLKAGFYSGFCFHRPPKRIGTAMALTAIILQSSQNDSIGGQSFSFFDKDLAFISKKFNDSTKDMLQAMEGFVYNLNTLYTRLGSQVPYSVLNLGTDTTKQGRLITKSILTALGDGLGNGETAVFPQVIFRIKKGINYHKGDPNYDLFLLALKISAKCMNPSFSFLDAPVNKSSNDVTYWNSGDRIYYKDKICQGSRGNIAQVTINLPHIALLTHSKKNPDDYSFFYSTLEKNVNLAGAILKHKYEIVSHLKVKELPFIMGEKLYLGSENLSRQDQIKDALKNGYLAISFTGLAEALTVLNKNHHGKSKSSQTLGIQIVKQLNTFIDTLRKKHELNFILSAGGADNLIGRLTDMDRQNFGKIKDVTDKDSYTHSFHIPGNYKMPLEEKLKIESQYHSLCPGGHFTFLNMEKAPESYRGIEKIIDLMYKAGIGYGGISFPIDECIKCGGKKISNGKCKNCGSSLIRHLRRKSFYIDALNI